MKILIACEYSGIVRDSFLALGHDAISCDLLPSESDIKILDAEGNNRLHYEGDVFDIINDTFDMMIAHPPCTYLSSSGLHWNTRTDPVTGELTPAATQRKAKTVDALAFITKLWQAPIEKICIENPVGCINTKLPFMPKPQYIQPYQYGHDASKKTGLWTRGLAPLCYYEDDYVEPRIVNGYKRWANQTDSGQNALPPSANRGHDRAKTYSGIAWAMAEAWG